MMTRTSDEQGTGLTLEQIAAEEALMEGLLPINIGALAMPPLWGPGHGQIVTILFYPLWIVVDNVIFTAYSSPSLASIALAVFVLAATIVVTLVYARLGQPLAAKRAIARGKTKECYIREERIWAIVCIVIAAAFVAFASWYNVTIRVAG